MWNTLAYPWQVCLEEAWAAYCAGTVPIGAAIVDAQGRLLARGRNQIKDDGSGSGLVRHNKLAHAELNALLQIDPGSQRFTYVLYTLVEPCPLCFGAFFMSGLRQLHYAARDPYAGSTNLLNTTPYLSSKPIRIHAPDNPALEMLVIAMNYEQTVFCNPNWFWPQSYFETWKIELPQATALGDSLLQSGQLRALRDRNASAQEMVHTISLVIDNFKM